LLETYGASSLMVGCTEFHLLAKAARAGAVPWRTCDPLDWIARRWQAAPTAAMRGTTFDPAKPAEERDRLFHHHGD
jgi:hypothetical protein